MSDEITITKTIADMKVQLTHSGNRIVTTILNKVNNELANFIANKNDIRDLAFLLLKFSTGLDLSILPLLKDKYYENISTLIIGKCPKCNCSLFYCEEIPNATESHSGMNIHYINYHCMK